MQDHAVPHDALEQDVVHRGALRHDTNTPNVSTTGQPKKRDTGSA
jgi:hypothetical protein